MAEIKENRQPLEERDFPILETMSLKMRDLILEAFEVTQIENTWPLRYRMNYKNGEFEWVFSAMGSVTLRISKSERYRRNPPPIFYLSVGKYAGKYRWEDGSAVEIPFSKEVIKEKVNIMVDMLIENGGVI
jgi:uncharacterized protein (DUF2249 family)